MNKRKSNSGTPIKRNSKNANSGKFKPEVIKIISKIARIEEKALVDDVLIREQLAIDSLMAIEIIANIEKKFGLKLDEEKMFVLSTLGEFFEYVESQQNKKRLSSIEPELSDRE
jgi:acyl carrier protein